MCEESDPFVVVMILRRVRLLKGGAFLLIDWGGRPGFLVDFVMHMLSPPSGISHGWPFCGQPAWKNVPSVSVLLSQWIPVRIYG